MIVAKKKPTAKRKAASKKKIVRKKVVKKKVAKKKVAKKSPKKKAAKQVANKVTKPVAKIVAQQSQKTSPKRLQTVKIQLRRLLRHGT